MGVAEKGPQDTMQACPFPGLSLVEEKDLEIQTDLEGCSSSSFYGIHLKGIITCSSKKWAMRVSIAVLFIARKN